MTTPLSKRNSDSKRTAKVTLTLHELWRLKALANTPSWILSDVLDRTRYTEFNMDNLGSTFGILKRLLKQLVGNEKLPGDVFFDKDYHERWQKDD